VLSIAILPGFAHIGHTNLEINILECLGVGSGRVLDTLVRVMDLWCRVLS